VSFQRQLMGISQPYGSLPIIGHLHHLTGRSWTHVLNFFLDASHAHGDKTFGVEFPMIAKGWFVSDPT